MGLAEYLFMYKLLFKLFASDAQCTKKYSTTVQYFDNNCIIVKAEFGIKYKQ